jgi:hypothetical protein
MTKTGLTAGRVGGSVLSAMLLLTIAAPAQTAPSDSARQEMIRRAMDRLRAGPEHAVLGALAGGRWTVTSRYADGAGRADVVITGSASTRTVLDGRFLVVEVAARSPRLEADSYTIYGYDRRFGRYTYVGHDSFGTYYVTAAGPYDSTSRSIRMAGEARQPNGSAKRYEMVLRVESEDRFVTEIWFDDGAARHRAVETVFVRARGGREW